MTRLEWWHDVSPGFVAVPELLQETFATRVANYETTVHPPSIAADDVTARSGFLAPPRIGGRRPAMAEDCWGDIHHGTRASPVGVVVQQLAFSTEITDDRGLPHAVESVVAAMDAWWDNVRAWLEIVTGQHLTQVGHQEVEVIGNKTPIWELQEDGTHGKKFNFDVTVDLDQRQVRGVTAGILRECVSRSAEGPSLAWTLVRDARSLHEVGQYRRAVIDVATAAELAVTKILDIRLEKVEEQVRTALLKAHTMLGRKKALLSALGCPLPVNFQIDLVNKRNEAVHDGIDIAPGECAAAIEAASLVVEQAFPLPNLPDTPEQLLWGRPRQANIHL
jgi:hypothetical protein